MRILLALMRRLPDVGRTLGARLARGQKAYLANEAERHLLRDWRFASQGWKCLTAMVLLAGLMAWSAGKGAIEMLPPAALLFVVMLVGYLMAIAARRRLAAYDERVEKDRRS